jgi:hypothetical protein
MKLDRVDVCDRFAEDPVFVYVVDDGLLFHLEYPGTKFRAVGSGLAWKGLLCNSWPIWVAG